MRRSKKSGRSIEALFWWFRYSTFSYSRAVKYSMAIHSSRPTQYPCVIFIVESLDSDAETERLVGIRGFCGMAVVWTLNVPGARTCRAPSIENEIWDGEGTSRSATVSRMLDASRGLQENRTSGGGLGDDFKAAPLERYLWARSAPYSLNDIGNPLKSQQMRPPSERTNGYYSLMRFLIVPMSSAPT